MKALVLAVCASLVLDQGSGGKAFLQWQSFPLSLESVHIIKNGPWIWKCSDDLVWVLGEEVELGCLVQRAWLGTSGVSGQAAKEERRLVWPLGLQGAFPDISFDS